VELLNRLVLRLVDFPKPTIAMVDGYAVGAGSNLALCCDLIVASERARFGELFWKIGLVPDGGGTWLLSRVVGLARAKELIFTADVIETGEAARIGLVNRVVPVAELASTTRALAEKIAAGPPAVLKMAKHMVNRAATSDLASALDLEAFSQGIAISSEDHQEGLAAFFEKRPAKFTGRRAAVTLRCGAGRADSPPAAAGALPGASPVPSRRASAGPTTAAAPGSAAARPGSVGRPSAV